MRSNLVFRNLCAAFLGILWATASRLSAAAPNDDAINAQPLQGIEGVLTVDLAGATLEPNEWLGWQPSWSPPRRSVWFTWTAPESGQVLFSVDHSESPSSSATLQAGIQPGAISTLSECFGPIISSATVEAGRQYYWGIRDAFGTSDRVTFSYRWVRNPTNDLWSQRTMIPADGSYAMGSAAGATSDSWESSLGLGHVVWHSWTAPRTGRAFPEVEGQGGGTLASFRGESNPPGTWVDPGEFGILMEAGEPLNIAVKGGLLAYRIRVRLETARLIGLPLLDWEEGSPAGVRMESSVWDGEIREVEFRVDQSPVILDSDAPFDLDLSRLPAGNHSVAATLIRRDGTVVRVPPVIIPIRPANDRFDAAHVLVGDSANVVVNAQAATAEPGEPTHAGLPPQRTIWWTWTAPRSTSLDLRFLADSSGTIAVYTGDSLASLVPVAGSDFASLRLKPTAGVTYRIAVNLRQERFESGTLEFKLRQVPPVPNDQFADALPLDGTAMTISASAEAATLEPGERSSQPDLVRSLWWRWTAPANGILNVTGSWSPFESQNTQMEVYDGTSLQSLIRLGGIGTIPPGIKVIAGRSYWIQAQTAVWYSTIQFDLRFDPLPTNDDFQEATLVVGLPVRASGQLAYATAEPMEPVGFGFLTPPSRSVWYQWEAPTTGPVTLTFPDLDFEFPSPPDFFERPVVTVFLGNALTHLDPVVSGGIYPGARLPFVAQQGTRYAIQVLIKGFTSGLIPFAFEILGPPQNDTSEHAILFPGPSGEIAGHTFYSTQEPGEPAVDGVTSFGSVWYRWMPFETGQVTLCLRGRILPNVQAFTQSEDGRFQRVAPLATLKHDQARRLLLPVTANRLLWIQVSSPRFGELQEFGTFFKLSLAQSDLSLTAPVQGFVGEGGGTVDTAARAQLTSAAGLVLLTDWLPPMQSPGLSGPDFQHTFSNLPPSRYQMFALGTNLAGQQQISPPIEFRIAPSNDDYTHSTEVESLPVLFNGTQAGSSVEAEEPGVSGNSEDQSRWWHWTAPRSGTVVLRGTGRVRVYQGTTLSQLILRAEWSPIAPTPVEVTAGETYRFQVLPLDPSYAREDSLVDILLAWNPPNDSFDAVEELSGSRLIVRADLAAATAEPEEPRSGPYYAQRSAWFRWTAPGDGWLRMADTQGRSDEIAAAFQTKAEGDLVPLGYTRSEWNPLRVPVVAGVEYLISLDDHSYTPRPAAAWELQWFPTVDNDAFATRRKVEGLEVELSGVNFGASREPGEPERRIRWGTITIDRTVWFSWTAPATGWARLETSEPLHSRFESSPWFVEPFTGETLDSLQSLWPANQEYGPFYRLDFWVEAGRTYQFLVGDTSPSNDPFRFVLTGPKRPDNDDFHLAEDVPSLATEIKGTVSNATWEEGEPSDPVSPEPRNWGTVWFRWKSPGRGVAALYGSINLLSIWQGDDLSSLRSLGRPDSHFVFRTEPGAVYFIRVAGGSLHQFYLAMTFGLSPGNDDFENAFLLEGTSLRETAATLYSTGEEGVGPGVWYRWKAPESGRLSIRFQDKESFGLYRGSGPQALAIQAWLPNSRDVFEVTGGETYHLHVPPYSNQPRTFDLEFVAAKPPELTPGRWQDGSFHLNLPDASGQWVDVEQSDDLEHWIPMGRRWLIPPVTPMVLPGDPAQRFIRLRTP